MKIESLPKVELHCHLDGILDPEMARDIYESDRSFPMNPAEFDQAYPVETFQQFVRWFDAVRSLDGSLKYFYPILERHVKRLKAQNVVYTEIMVVGGTLPVDPLQTVDEMSRYRDWANGFEEENFQIEFLVALGRRKSPEEFAVAAERIFALHKAGLIVGVALAGPEEENRVRPLHSTFARFRDAGIKIEVHAGEWCGPDSVWDALEYGYPDRIGHGISVFQDPKLLSLIQERGIHLEFCPTSNLKTGSIACIEEHPLRKAAELGLSFSVNTDDPGPFCNSMSSEYLLLADTFLFDISQFNTIFRNALAARFQKELRIKLAGAL